jgi:hypothetical protein
VRYAIRTEGGERVFTRVPAPEPEPAVAADPEHGVEADNPSGSYEALMGMLTGPGPEAGG